MTATLFYNSLERSGVVGDITASGLTTGQVFKPGSFSAWTHVVSQKKFLGDTLLFFYDQPSGMAAIGKVKNGQFLQTKGFPAGTVGKWTHIVATSGWFDSLLYFFNSDTGSAAVAELGETNLTFTKKVDGAGFMLPGSAPVSDIVAIGTTVFVYKRGKRSGSVNLLSRDGLRTTREFRDGAVGAWTHIAAAGELLFFYNDLDRSGAIGRLSPDDLVILQTMPAGSLSPWTHIVSGDSELLFRKITLPGHDRPKLPAGAEIKVPGQEAAVPSPVVNELRPGLPADMEIVLPPGRQFAGGTLLFYDVRRGAGAVVAVHEDGLTTVQNFASGSFSPWTNIANTAADIGAYNWAVANIKEVNLFGHKLTRSGSGVHIKSGNGSEFSMDAPLDGVPQDKKDEAVRTVWENAVQWVRENREGIESGRIKAEDIGGVIYGLTASAVLIIFAPAAGAAMLGAALGTHFKDAASQVGRYYGAMVDDFVAILKNEPDAMTVAHVVGTLATIEFASTFVTASGLIPPMGVKGWELTKEIGAQVGGPIEEGLKEIEDAVTTLIDLPGDAFDAARKFVSNLLDVF